MNGNEDKEIWRISACLEKVSYFSVVESAWILEKKHYKLRITGKVQGVWYRASSRNKALELNLQGFARNEPDGSVYIEAEGTEDQLKQFVAWAGQGPDLAEVERVDVEEGPLKAFEGFHIRR